MSFDDKTLNKIDFDFFGDVAPQRAPLIERAFGNAIPNSAPLLFLVVVLVALTGCSGGGDKPNPKQIVGMDQRDVRQCMGTPTRTAELGTRQIWSYEGQAPVAARKQYASATPPQREINAMAGEFQSAACVLHVEFKQGEARDVSYYVTTEGRPGDKDKRCAFLAKRCQD